MQKENENNRVHTGDQSGKNERNQISQEKVPILRPVKSVGRMIPDAVDTLVYCYLGMAPITVPITAIFLAGAVEKILQVIL